MNFGWAVTPQPKVIPFDGSTIQVFIDGAPVGTASYNHFRADIAGFFLGLANSNGAVGFRVIDTTMLADGLHTIAWGVTDSAGAAEGIGSRYFTVANGVAATSSMAAGALSAMERSIGPVASAQASATPGADSPFDDGRAAPSGPLRVHVIPLDRTAMRGRRGFDVDTPLRDFPIDAAGRPMVRGEELDRFELHVGDGGPAEYTGYLRVGRELASLPIGSSLNATTGLFTWAPGVGFVGTYDLVFVRADHGAPASRRELRIVLHAKGSGRLGPQVVIDTPRVQEDLGQPFLLAGWAVDLDAASGTGIDTLHVWAYPLTGDAPIFLGVAEYGGARADVAAVHGQRFRGSGYGLVVQGLVPGNYDLAVFGWSTVRGGFAPAGVVRVTGR